MLSGVPPTCFSLFSCCRESRQRVFLCFHAVGSPANVFFFVFVLSGVPPTCFSLFSCCRGSRQRVFLCFCAVGSPANVFFFVFMLSGVPPTCFSLFFVLSGVPPTCFSLFLCCRDPRRDIFFRIFIIGHHIADKYTLNWAGNNYFIL